MNLRIVIPAAAGFFRQPEWRDPRFVALGTTILYSQTADPSTALGMTNQKVINIEAGINRCVVRPAKKVGIAAAVCFLCDNRGSS
jgi:hypothetical protein